MIHFCDCVIKKNEPPQLWGFYIQSINIKIKTIIFLNILREGLFIILNKKHAN